MTPHITLLPHQNAAVSRALGEPSVLFDHVVGAGKTFTLAATAMELKRLGLVNKPVLAVPNPLMGQWIREIRELYPGARVLAADSESLTKNGRQAFAARATASDWDLVLMTHESFESIPVDEAWAVEYLSREIEFLEKQKQAALADGQDERTIKQIERDLAQAQETIADQIERRKDDDGINFARLGFDYVMTDEAHVYKNLSFFTTSQAVSSPEGSGRAQDMHMKLEYLRSIKAGQANPRIAAFATGTPISNSLAEMYTFTRFLRPDLLDEHGVATFDEWAATFARASAKLEVNTAASGYTSKVRMRGFSEALGDGLRIWRTFTDTKTADMLNLPRPQLKGGSRNHHVVQPSEGQELVLASFLRRFQNMPRGRDRMAKGADNDVAIIGDGRANAISPRMVSERGLSWAGLDRDDSSLTSPKLERMADEITAIYQRMKDTRYRVKAEDDTADWSPIPGALQMVMMDSGTPKKTGEWSGYAELKQQLADRGVPAGQIEWIQDYKGPERRAELFERARNGQISVLMGSTGALGTGTNVQNRLIALHHADGSWKPADIEQREGRILRRGNQNPEIEIHVYLTQRTHDEKTWDMTAYKQRGLNAIAHGDYSMKGIEFEDDSDPLTDFDTLVGMASGDPLVMDQRTLDADLRKLERAHRAWSRQRAHADSTAEMYRSRLRRTESSIELLTLAQQQRVDTSGDAFSMRVTTSSDRDFGTTLTSRKDASEVLGKRLQALFESGHFGIQERRMGTIAILAGFNINASTTTAKKGGKAVILRLSLNDAPLPIDAVEVLLPDIHQNKLGLITRLESRARSIDDRVQRSTRDIDMLNDEIQRAEDTRTKPFRNAAALRSIRERKELVDTILNEDRTTNEAGEPLDKEALRAEYGRITTEHRQSAAAARDQQPESEEAEENIGSTPNSFALQFTSADEPETTQAPGNTTPATEPPEEPTHAPEPTAPHDPAAPDPPVPTTTEPAAKPEDRDQSNPITPEQAALSEPDAPAAPDSTDVIMDDVFGEVSRGQLQAYHAHGATVFDHEQLQDELHPFNRNAIADAVRDPVNHTSDGRFSLELFLSNRDDEPDQDPDPASPDPGADDSSPAQDPAPGPHLDAEDETTAAAASDTLFSLDDQGTRPAEADATSAAPSPGMARMPEPAGAYEGPWTPTRVQSKAANFDQVVAAYLLAGSDVQSAGYEPFDGGIEVHDPERARYSLDRQKAALDAGPNTPDRSKQLAFLTRMQDRIAGLQREQLRAAAEPERPVRSVQELARLLNEEGRPRDHEYERLTDEHREALKTYFRQNDVQRMPTYQATKDLINDRPYVPDEENATKCDSAAALFALRAEEARTRGWPKLAAYHEALVADAKIYAKAWRDGVMVFGAGYSARPERRPPGIAKLDDGVTAADREGTYDDGSDERLWDRVAPLALDHVGRHLTSEVEHLRQRQTQVDVPAHEWQRAMTQTLEQIENHQYALIIKRTTEAAKGGPGAAQEDFHLRAVQFGQHLHDLAEHLRDQGIVPSEDPHPGVPAIADPSRATNSDFLDTYGAYARQPSEARYNLLRSMQFAPEVPTDPGWQRTLEAFKTRTWTETLTLLPQVGLREAIAMAQTALTAAPTSPTGSAPPATDERPPRNVTSKAPRRPSSHEPRGSAETAPNPSEAPSLAHRAWQEIYNDRQATETALHRAQNDGNRTDVAAHGRRLELMEVEFQAHEQAMFPVSGATETALHDLRTEAALFFRDQRLAVPIAEYLDQAVGLSDVPAAWAWLSRSWGAEHPEDPDTLATIRSYARRAASMIEADRAPGQLPESWQAATVAPQPIPSPPPPARRPSPATANPQVAPSAIPAGAQPGSAADQGPHLHPDEPASRRPAAPTAPSSGAAADQPTQASRPGSSPRSGETNPSKRMITDQAVAALRSGSTSVNDEGARDLLSRQIDALTWTRADAPIPTAARQAIDVVLSGIPAPQLPGSLTHIGIGEPFTTADERFRTYGLNFTNSEGRNTRLHLLHTSDSILTINLERVPSQPAEAPRRNPAQQRTWDPGTLERLRSEAQANGSQIGHSELLTQVSQRLNTLTWVQADQPIPLQAAQALQSFVARIPAESQPGQLQAVAYAPQQDSTQFPTFFGLSFQSPDGGETRLHLVQNPSSIGVLCLDVITPATSRTQPARSHPEETPATWPTTAATARTTASSSERPPPPTTPLAPPRPVATHR
nr:DEAD/DEAH box helicase family protein [Kineosporia rhizophila]